MAVVTRLVPSSQYDIADRVDYELRLVGLDVVARLLGDDQFAVR
jgi:hypothetical protein